MQKKMTDLKITKSLKRQRASLSSIDSNNYPWGTELSLDASMVKKLGIEGFEPGDMVSIHAVGKITGKNISDQADSEKVTSMNIQLQKMVVMSEDDEKAKTRNQAAEEAYGK